MIYLLTIFCTLFAATGLASDLQYLNLGDAAMYNTIHGQNIPAQDAKYRRELSTYYRTRLYPGSPPMIPHEVVAGGNSNGKECLSCHRYGGWVEKEKAYAPTTPHPRYVQCLQCHVPEQTKNLFVGTNWQSTQTAKIKRPALAGGPPPIPHTLQLRENCTACHSGPSAPIEIRTSHPERVQCRQCHVPQEGGPYEPK